MKKDRSKVHTATRHVSWEGVTEELRALSEMGGKRH